MEGCSAIPFAQPSPDKIKGKAKSVVASRIELLDRPCLASSLKAQTLPRLFKDHVEVSLHSLYNIPYPKLAQVFFSFFSFNFMLDFAGAHPVATRSQ